MGSEAPVSWARELIDRFPKGRTRRADGTLTPPLFVVEHGSGHGDYYALHTALGVVDSSRPHHFYAASIEGGWVRAKGARRDQKPEERGDELLRGMWATAFYLESRRISPVLPTRDVDPLELWETIPKHAGWVEGHGITDGAPLHAFARALVSPDYRPAQGGQLHRLLQGPVADAEIGETNAHLPYFPDMLRPAWESGKRLTERIEAALFGELEAGELADRLLLWKRCFWDRNHGMSRWLLYRALTTLEAPFWSLDPTENERRRDAAISCRGLRY